MLNREFNRIIKYLNKGEGKVISKSLLDIDEQFHDSEVISDEGESLDDGSSPESTRDRGEDI